MVVEVVGVVVIEFVVGEGVGGMQGSAHRDVLFGELVPGVCLLLLILGFGKR